MYSFNALINMLGKRVSGDRSIRSQISFKYVKTCLVLMKLICQSQIVDIFMVENERRQATPLRAYGAIR